MSFAPRQGDGSKAAREPLYRSSGPRIFIRVVVVIRVVVGVLVSSSLYVIAVVDLLDDVVGGSLLLRHLLAPRVRVLLA